MSSVAACNIISPNGINEECARFDISSDANAFTLANVTIRGNQYTFNCWIRSCEQGTVYVDINVGHDEHRMTVTENWSKWTYTFIASQTDVILQFGTPGRTYCIYHPQLELGNKVTDWTPAPEDTDAAIMAARDEVRGELVEQSASLITTCKGMVSTATAMYVKKDDHQNDIDIISSQLNQRAGDFEISFTEYHNRVKDVDDSLNNYTATMSKYIRFTSETAIEIGSGDSAITLEIDNETGIVFKKNGKEFGRWDGVDFHTGNIVVEVQKRAQFGNFAFVPRTDGSLSFLKVSE